MKRWRWKDGSDYKHIPDLSETFLAFKILEIVLQLTKWSLLSLSECCTGSQQNRLSLKWFKSRYTIDMESDFYKQELNEWNRKLYIKPCAWPYVSVALFCCILTTNRPQATRQITSRNLLVEYSRPSMPERCGILLKWCTRHIILSPKKSEIVSMIWSAGCLATDIFDAMPTKAYGN